MFNFLSNTEQKRCNSEISNGIQWNTTLAGKTKREPCPPNQKGDSLRIEINKVIHLISDAQFIFPPYFPHIKTYMHEFQEMFHNLLLFL